MITSIEMRNISPATTHCSELEYLIALQSEEAGSQLRRSQRLREKNSTKDALECTRVVSAEDRVGSPQLFADIDEECSQLAQIPPNHIAAPNNSSKGALENPVESELNNNELPKIPIGRIRSASRKRGRRPKKQIETAQTITAQIDPVPVSFKRRGRPKKKSMAAQALIATQSEPVPEIIPLDRFELSSQQRVISMPGKTKSKSRTNRKHSKSQVKPVQSIQLGQEPILTSNAGKERDSAGILQCTTTTPLAAEIPPKVSTVVTNSTQSYSYQCMNLTQTLLPERYPAHFVHQLPSAPKYATGTILSGELQRVSSATIVNESNKISDSISTDSEQLSPSPPNVESWGSTTPSLSESLTEVFGTRKIRDALNIALPRQYRVLESQLPDIAFMLGVKVERLRNVLELTERLTLDELQQSRYESPDLSSEADVELVGKPCPYKLTTKSCKIVG
ncbi:uncharacterized protein LOC108651935 [Drosophila navojoa]|nr:uncharacterized protein LOC108651935 [Drosophila navojoa]